jgi:Fe2+ or Zn2+ uptake regulation protein
MVWYISRCELFATRVAPATQLKQRRQLFNEIRAHGLSMTRQRRVMADLLQKAGDHLDAPEVLQRPRQQVPGLHLVTVYRAIGSLKGLGIIGGLDLMHVNGHGHYYEARTKRDHMHSTCYRCGSVLEIQTPLFDRLKGQIEGRHGLSIHAACYELGGLCGDCGSRKEKTGSVTA